MTDTIEVNVLADSQSTAKLHAGRMARTLQASGFMPVDRVVVSAKGELWQATVKANRPPSAADLWRQQDSVTAQ